VVEKPRPVDKGGVGSDNFVEEVSEDCGRTQFARTENIGRNEQFHRKPSPPHCSSGAVVTQSPVDVDAFSTSFL
jgi:hypothetical protein